MLKKALSLVFVLVLLVSCLPLSASAAEEYRDYRDLEMTLSTPGLPQYIKCIFQYNTENTEIVSDYPGFEPEGFYFPMAEDTFDYMYDVAYQVEDGLITFEYTLKPGYDLEYLEDCLDRTAAAERAPLIKRGENVRHTLTLFHAAACFKVRNWYELDVSYKLKVQDMVLTDGTVMMQDGNRLSDAYSSIYPYNLAKPETPAPEPDRYHELTLSQYHMTYDQLSSFETIYKHQAEDGAVDWALVRAVSNSPVDTPAYYEFCNRVLDIENSGIPFTFNVGVYNAKRMKMFDLTECKAEDYPDLEEVWTEIGDGRLIGDMDADNSLTVSDAAIIQRCAADITPYPEDDVNPAAGSNPDAIKYFSDFDADGDRGIVDATMIQRYIADMPHRTEEWSAYELPTEAFHTPDDLSIPRITGFRSLGSGIEISIDPVPGAEKYRFYFKNKNGNWEKMGETTGAPFVSTNAVEVGKTYTYTVRCIKADLSSFTSDYYKTGWSYTYDPQLDTPQITHIEATNDGVKISWAPVEGAEKYRVFYRHAEYGSWDQIGDTDATNYLHTAAWDGSEYYYTVRCLSKNGNGFASAYDPEGVPFRLRHTPELDNMQANPDGVSFTVRNISDPIRKIAVYRKEKSGWKRIDVVPEGSTYIDTDAVPGKTYTYTCRCLSDDGSYFVSKFNSTGWTQKFTVDEVIPVLEYYGYSADNEAYIHPRGEDKFNIPKFAVEVCDKSDNYLCTFIIDSYETYFLTDEIFEKYNELKLYFFGLDENEELLTYYKEGGFSFKKVFPRENLRAVKLDDRKYRFRWDAGKSGYYETMSNFNLTDFDGTLIDSDLIYSSYYDVDLSDYPEDKEWTAYVVATAGDGVSVSQAIAIDFCEADFNSKTE